MNFKHIIKVKNSKKEAAMEKRFNIISLTDWHVPYEDKNALNLAFNFCGEIQPDIIIVHELHDFYTLSRFHKDPTRKEHLQVEIDLVNKYLKDLRRKCPKSRIILLQSNHLERLRKYLWSVAPALAGLRSLRVEALLELKKLDIEYKPDFLFRGVLFKHGNIVRQDSSYTAKGEFLKEGCSGVSGHTHRLGLYYVTKRGGKFVWVESGCLCKTKAEYVEGTANWQNGISLVSFKQDSRKFYATVIPIIDNTLLFGRV